MLEFEEYTVAPGTPPADIVVVYAKGDGRLYGKDDTGAEFALALTLPVPVASGGTGSTTAGGARSNLGAAASGANSDITSLTGLTTPLSVAQGGTDSATAAGARTNLAAAQSGANSDITSLTGLTTAIPISEGGTGQTTQTAAFNALDPLTTKGDIITHDGTNSVRKAVGANGFAVIADSTVAEGWKWAAPTAGVFNPATTVQLYDDFFSGGEETGEIGQLGWVNYGTGTGNNFTRIDGLAGHPGIARLVPGTVEAGRQAICLGDPGGLAHLVVGGGEITYECCIKVTQASTALFEEIAFGFGDVFNAVGDQANGVYFRFLGGLTPDTTWKLVTANASTRSTSDTSQAYSSGTFIRFGFIINAAGTSVQAYVNGSSAGSAITTNFPSGAISPFFKADAIVGGATTNFDVDYFYTSITLTTSR